MKTLLISIDQDSRGITHVRTRFTRGRELLFEDVWRVENDWLPVDHILKEMWDKFTKTDNASTYEAKANIASCIQPPLVIRGRKIQCIKEPK